MKVNPAPAEVDAYIEWLEQQVQAKPRRSYLHVYLVAIAYLATVAGVIGYIKRLPL